MPDAKEYLKGISVDDLISQMIYANARELGFQRLKSAVSGEEFNMPPLRNEIIQRDVFLSFIFAKLLLIAMQDPIMTRRFANAERDRLEKNLLDVNEDIPLVAQSFGINFEAMNDRIYRIHFIDFIRYGKAFNSDEFRLINYPLKGGWLNVKKGTFIKIIREAFVENFVNDIEAQAEKSKMLKKPLQSYIAELESLKDAYLSTYTGEELGDVEVDAFPPCMKNIITRIKEGMNVSHEARFVVVTFLHRIGMSNEEILKIFATVPDFRKDLTEYQIKHITGETSGKEYKVPKCATLRAYGLCVRDVAKDKLCYKEWMTYPLLYYKMKKEKIKKGSSKLNKNAEQQ